MKLITEVHIPDYPFRMDYRSSILMMGSCFTDLIGGVLVRNLFPVSVNPFGVIYNPLSIRKALVALIRKDAYVADDLHQYNDLWFSFDHYTLFSSPSRNEALHKINLRFQEAKEILQSAEFLVITWGTAWVYTYNASGEVVCNCHKIPASEFTRSRLTPEAIIGAYHEFLSELFAYNQNLKIIFTVSPVRHWKDGAHGNQLSKAVLLLAQETLVETYPDRVFYFPSYEIVMDELRDYRYYARDMLHTNDQATQYIWEKFGHSLLSNDARSIIRELDPVLKMMEHRPHLQSGEAYEKMLQQRDEKVQQLKEKYPFLAWKHLPGI